MRTMRLITRAMLPAIILMIVVAVTFIGCAKRKPHYPVPKDREIPGYTDEELAKGFYVNLVRGSSATEIVEGAQTGIPPFRFFLIVSNPDNSPMELSFTSSLKTDMRLYSGETEMFRFADTKRARNDASTVEIPARSKKSWPLVWDGRLSDGSYPPSGIYAVDFILNSNPPYKLMVDNVDIAFPREQPEEDESADGDIPNS